MYLSPTVPWTPEQLWMWHGLRPDEGRAILRKFAACGVVRKVREGTYEWNTALDWAVPRAARAAPDS